MRTLETVEHVVREQEAALADAKAALKESEDRFLRLMKGVKDYALYMLDSLGNVASWNAGAELIEGYKAQEILGKPLSTFYAAAEDGHAQRNLQTAALTGRVEEEGWRVRKDGSQFWANVVITALRDPDGTLRGYGKITRDLTERRKTDLELRSSEERFRLMVEGVQDYAILMLDVDGNVATWNSGAQRFKGYRADEIIGRHFSVFYPAEDIALGKPERMLTTAAAEGRLEDEGWRVRKDGSQFWANVVITALRDPDGTLRGFGKITRDRSYERQLEHMVDRDPLTGVLNSRRFARELAGHVARSAESEPAGALLMIDLDNFKLFNDTQGHGAGDQLIVRIARILQSRLRSTDVLARLGGDEFAVLLPTCDARATQTVADAVLQVIRDEPMPAILSGDRRITASIGIARFDDGDRLTPEEILANADSAMYDAKRLGRDRAVRYGGKQHRRRRSESEPRWAQEIGYAIDHDGFELVAQPIVPLKTLKPGGPSRYELLLRMRDRNGAIALPGAFLPIAERLGRMGEIDRWVTARAIDLIAEQRRLGRDVQFEVNLAGSTMSEDGLLELLERRLHEAHVPPGRLVFEVSETAALTHTGRAVRFAEHLAKLGCGFAIDDFGASFGSFYHIKHLPFDCLKIDGEFIQHCVENEIDRMMISAIVQVARGMGKETTAEYVGSAQTAKVLTRLGVDYGQGFHLGRPAALSVYLAEPVPG